MRRISGVALALVMAVVMMSSALMILPSTHSRSGTNHDQSNDAMIDARPGPPKKPDLIVSRIWTVPASPTSLDMITFYYEVKNQGTAAITTTFQNYAWMNGLGTSVGVCFSLGIGATFVWTYTTKLAAGTYENKATADFGASISELVETNNQLVTYTYVTYAADKTDLTAWTLSWTDSYGSSSGELTAGQPFAVSAQIYCNSNIGCGAFEVALTVAGVDWGQKTVSGLAAFSFATVTWSNVYTAASDSCTVSVIADPDNHIVEMFETNNALSMAVKVNKADWTLLVYFNADSPMMYEREWWTYEDYANRDLETCVLDNFKELACKDFTLTGEGTLRHAGSSPRLSIVAVMDMREGVPDMDLEHYVGFYDGWTDTKLFYVYPDCKPLSANALPASQWPSSLTPGELNLASPTPLAEFGKWAFTRFESNHQCIIMQVFGASWFGISEDLDGAPVTSTTYDIMTAAELGSALYQIRQTINKNIDVLGLDALFGGGLELVAGLSSSVDWVISHEGMEPELNEDLWYFTHSWPYHIIADDLRQAPQHGMDVNNDGYWSSDEFTTWMTYDSGPYSWYYSSGFSDAAMGCRGMKHIAAYKPLDVETQIVPWVNNLADVLSAKILADPSFRDVLWDARARQNALIYVNDWFWYTWNGDNSNPVYLHRNADIANLAVSIKSATSDQQLAGACDALLNACFNAISKTWGFSFPIPGGSPGDFTSLWIMPCGLSVYWPETASKTTPMQSSEMQNLAYYGSMDFSINSKWDDFLRVFCDAAPPTCSVVIDGGAQYTSSNIVTLTLTASDDLSGIKEVFFSNDGLSWQGPESLSSPKQWPLSPGDGAKTVYFKVRDYVGRESISTDGIVLDTTAPSASISISSGAVATSSQTVTLTLTASDGGSGIKEVYYLNGDPGCIWVGPESYVSTRSWGLVTTEGTKTVYYRVVDNVGMETIVSDTIVLDWTSPICTAAVINSGAVYATSASVTVTTTASDAVSGIQYASFSNDGGAWSSWYTYSQNMQWSLTSSQGTRTVTVRVMDFVGLISGSQSDTIFLDLTDPYGTVLINGGVTYTTSTAATLTLFARDSGSGVYQVCYSNDGVTWSAWEAYTTSKEWTLTSGDGTKTVYYKVMDRAGWTTIATDTIQMDALGPTTSITLYGEHYRNQYLAPVGAGITASDPGSGVASIWYRIGSSGSFVLYTSTLGFYGLGSYTVYAYAIDNNGHVGSTTSASFKIVSALPW